MGDAAEMRKGDFRVKSNKQSPWHFSSMRGGIEMIH